MGIRRWAAASVAASLMVAGVATAQTVDQVDPAVSVPGPRSTSGDYATDVLSDPWDFKNDEDVPPIPLVGAEPPDATISRTDADDGRLVVSGRAGTTIKLVRTWGAELAWGRDGRVKPIQAEVYNKITVNMCVSGRGPLPIAFRWYNEFGQEGFYPFYPVGCETRTYDLLDRSLYGPPPANTPWAGKIIRFELLIGPGGTVNLDWVRIHRADAPAQPPVRVPIPRIITPNEEGGADYATSNGNPWDFCGPDDIGSRGVGDLANVAFRNCDMYGQTIANDSFVDLPLRTDINTDRYHRATVDVCYSGGMSFANAPGGGMNARFAWLRRGAPIYTETQDIIIYPGCNRMTFDLATLPPDAVNDENSILKEGWRGQTLDHLRFDLNEDPGTRSFQLNEIKLADDAAFTDSYPITFVDAAGVPGTTADIFVTTGFNTWDGVQIAKGVPVGGGVNTFTWNGTDLNGAQLPNGTYWVWMTMTSAGGVGSAHSTGPVRIERPVPATPSFFVPLNPSRLLDTRNGTGGNIVKLDAGVFTELDVTGVGGVPETNVTAVVMNVAVADPTAAGFITAWPSGEPRPLVASLNFLPFQVVPNLVTVKVGANGKVNLFNSAGNVNLVADVMGYYTDLEPASGGRFTALTPARLLDTRDGTGTGGATNPIPTQQSINLKVTDVGGVPATGVTGVALNVTVDSPTSSGFLSVWPTGEARPFTATHNFVPNLTVGNLVLAKVGANGQVSIFNSSGATHVVADVVGYFSGTGAAFVPTAPRRLLDTRNGTGGHNGTVGPSSSIDVVLATGDPIPGNASAAVMNVISVDSSQQSYVTAWPTGSPRPLAATMNPRPGVPVPNQAYLKLGDGGALSLYNFAGSTHLVIDAFGYFVP